MLTQISWTKEFWKEQEKFVQINKCLHKFLEQIRSPKVQFKIIWGKNKWVQFLTRLEHKMKMKNLFISIQTYNFLKDLLSSASGLQKYREGGLICKKGLT